MTFTTRAKAFYRALERFAEAIEADPVDELRQRIARLERRATMEAPEADEQTDTP